MRDIFQSHPEALRPDYEVQGPLIVRRVQILSKIRSGLSNHLVRIPDLGLLLVKSGGKKHGR